MLGMIPYSFTFTSHIIVTFALATIVFIGVTISIIIATLIGFYVLREQEAKGRIVPALLVVAGITILYMQTKQ